MGEYTLDYNFLPLSYLLTSGSGFFGNSLDVVSAMS